jgi:hypothetical protein
MGVVGDCWQDFDAAVGAWRLEERPVEQLPDAAVQALVDGCDTAALARLAGMQGQGWSEIEPVLRQVFEERERELPSQDEAVKLVADAVLRQVVAGDVDPREALERLRKLKWKAVDRPAFEDLLVFDGLLCDWELVEKKIVPEVEMPPRVRERAAEMLACGGVRLG